MKIISLIMWIVRSTSFVIGLVVASIIMPIVLQFVFSWKTPAAADQKTHQAVVAALSPICAKGVRARPDAQKIKNNLYEVAPWQWDQVLPSELTTIPGEALPDHDIGENCAEMIAPQKRKSASLPPSGIDESPPDSHS